MAHLITLALMLLVSIAVVACALAVAAARGALDSRIPLDAWVEIIPAPREPARWFPIKQPYSLATFRVLLARDALRAVDGFSEKLRAHNAAVMEARRKRTVDALERLKLNELFDTLMSDLDAREEPQRIANMYQHRRFAS